MLARERLRRNEVRACAHLGWRPDQREDPVGADPIRLNTLYV